MPCDKRDRGQAAALATAAETQVDDVLLHGHQVGTSAVHGDGRVHLLFENGQNLLGHVAGEITGRAGGEDLRDAAGCSGSR